MVFSFPGHQLYHQGTVMRVLTLLLALTLISGCRPSDPERSHANDTVSSSSDVTILMFKNTAIEKGHRKQVSLERVDDPSEEQLLSAFDSLPWLDEKFSPYIGLGRTKSGIRIQRPPADLSSASIVVFWNDDSTAHRVDMMSKTLSSPDVARKILIAFNKGEDLAPLTEWQQAE